MVLSCVSSLNPTVHEQFQTCKLMQMGILVIQRIRDVIKM